MTIPDKQQKIKELKLKWAQAVSQESLLSIQTDGPKRYYFCCCFCISQYQNVYEYSISIV